MSETEIKKSILPLIEKSAPLIATALGGPIGSAVGWAVGLLAHAFNSDPTDIKSLADAMQNDENLHDKLCDLESKNCDWLQKILSDIKIKMPVSAEITLKIQWAD